MNLSLANVKVVESNTNGRTHGLAATYNYGCRCHECTNANTIRVRANRQSKRLTLVPE